MESKISGGCACGAVRYTGSGKVQYSLQCHCRKCQRATGGGHSSIFALLVNEVELTGDPTLHEQTSDAGFTTSTGFCPVCGSPMIAKTEQFPEILYFHAATLDDPSSFKPEFAVFADSAPGWDHIDPDLPQPHRNETAS